MYGIYANIWAILMVNVPIYRIHGSYGYVYTVYCRCFFPLEPPQQWGISHCHVTVGYQNPMGVKIWVWFYYPVEGEHSQKPSSSKDFPKHMILLKPLTSLVV